ncbi:hypothetical protein CYMTET_41031 [Cymbomonas tetramitiformis]|uniref:Right handed beta helix domain-containing protein n=1 Tax=Cymbomonas tetramitiformis TaxID=36881 RepID=A0AAE0F416_9CHLO|nr:hypothetical protein CYMTET_41031 [Cymbomonas tetramitiformis]
MFPKFQRFLLTRTVLLLITLLRVSALNPEHAIKSQQTSFDIIDANGDECIAREEYDSFLGGCWETSWQRLNESACEGGSVQTPCQITFPLTEKRHYNPEPVVKEAQTPADRKDVPSSPDRKLTREAPAAAPPISESIQHGTAQLGEALATDSIETVVLYSNVSIESGSPLPVLERPLAILGQCDDGNLCELNGNYGERHLSVGPGGELLLRDVALRRGNATQGGALYLFEGGLATLEDCVLEDNSALEGGAVYLSGSGTAITLSACFLLDNAALSSSGGGGAVYSGFDSATILSAGTQVYGNRAVYGGGLYVHGEGSYLQASSSKIHDNYAYQDGGGVCGEDARMELLEGCTFTRNTAVLSGGAVFLHSSKGVYQNSTFVQNTAHSGGAICGKSMHINVTNCEISENRGRENGGGIFLSENSSFVMARSIVSLNTAEDGAGIYLDRSWADFQLYSVLDSNAAADKVLEIKSGDTETRMAGLATGCIA